MALRSILRPTQLTPLGNNIVFRTATLNQCQHAWSRISLSSSGELSKEFMNRRASTVAKSNPKRPTLVKKSPQKPVARKPLPEKPTPKFMYREALVIYHAGMGRTVFLAVLKLTTVFVFVFFAFLVAPTYAKAGRPWWQVAGMLAVGAIPMVFVQFLTSPVVALIHLRLPQYARESREILTRFAKNVPGYTPVDVTTLNMIGKPRVSTMKISDLQPVRKRMGMVNYVRDTKQENASRKWYNFPAVGNFRIEPESKHAKEAWVWEEVASKIGRKQK